MVTFVNSYLLDMLGVYVVLQAHAKQVVQTALNRSYGSISRGLEIARKRHFPVEQMYEILRHSKMISMVMTYQNLIY